MVRSVNLMTLKTALSHRLMDVVPFEIITSMAIVTQFIGCLGNQSAVVGSVGIVTSETTAIGNGLVLVRTVQTQFLGVMTAQAESLTGFFESQSADQSMRFVAGKAFLTVERFVPFASRELIGRVAFKAVTFLSESFSLFDLPDSILAYQ